jgi:hypothetical protein
MAKEFIWEDEGYGFDPHKSMPKVECRVCGLMSVRDSMAAAAADIYNHVVREHPEVYTAVVGHPPIPQQVQETTYGLLEGMLAVTSLEI